MKRVGLLGGAFNPPHLGHLRLAELALEHLDLDELRFVPTALSPHKPTPGDVAPETRLALLKTALQGFDPRCTVDTVELDRGGTSYTSDTLERLCASEPGTAWILIIGSDQLPGLPRWHRAARVFEIASVAVAPRPGAETNLPGDLPLKVEARWSGAPGELCWLPGTDSPLSSKALRAALVAGVTSEGIPPQVLAVIRDENLYR